MACPRLGNPGVHNGDVWVGKGGISCLLALKVAGTKGLLRAAATRNSSWAASDVHLPAGYMFDGFVFLEGANGEEHCEDKHYWLNNERMVGYMLA